MAGIELDDVDAWLYDRLTAALAAADLAVAVYAEVAPESAGRPFVVYDANRNHDAIGVGGVRIMVHATYVVRVVGEGRSYAPLRPIAEVIDAALHGARSVAVGSGAVLGCVRTETVRYRTVEGGRPWSHLGGRFDLVAQAAAA